MELLASFKPRPKAGADHGHEDDEQLETIARKIAAMPEREIAAAILSFFAAEKHDEAKKRAIVTAESWLALVDDGKYGESWDAAAEYLKNAMAKDAFVKSLTATRKPLDKLKGREVNSKDYRTSLPGHLRRIRRDPVQDGLRKQEVGHRDDTPMLDKDGKWKVSGYFIR